jgi:hypothetical protein
MSIVRSPSDIPGVTKHDLILPPRFLSNSQHPKDMTGWSWPSHRRSTVVLSSSPYAFAWGRPCAAQADAPMTQSTAWIPPMVSRPRAPLDHRPSAHLIPPDSVGDDAAPPDQCPHQTRRHPIPRRKQNKARRALPKVDGAEILVPTRGRPQLDCWSSAGSRWCTFAALMSEKVTSTPLGSWRGAQTTAHSSACDFWCFGEYCPARKAPWRRRRARLRRLGGVPRPSPGSLSHARSTVAPLCALYMIMAAVKHGRVGKKKEIPRPSLYRGEEVGGAWIADRALVRRPRTPGEFVEIRSRWNWPPSPTREWRRGSGCCTRTRWLQSKGKGSWHVMARLLAIE